MFFVPLSTDAPIYHRPWGTIGLIVVNTLAFLLMVTGPSEAQDEWFVNYGLLHGAGIHPVQWVTSNFLHGGFMHLISNMFFLWAFGLVVEGKIGTGPFLGVYAGIACGECALEQICLLGADPGVSFGASSAIFGLMAIALIWAPRNEITVGYSWVLRTGILDIPIQHFALWMIVVQVILAFVLGFQVTSEVLHLAGAGLGAGVAWLFLKKKWVDCENWDLFSIMAGKHMAPIDGSPAPVRKGPRLTREGKPAKKKKLVDPVRRKVKHLERLRRLLTEGKPRAAFDEWVAARHFAEEQVSFQTDLVNLAGQLQAAGYLREAMEVHLHFIERFPNEADRVRIEVAELMFRHQRRPHAAMRILEPLDDATLPPELSQRLNHLRREAAALIDSGHLEIEGTPNL